jgi:hypothetical protein
MNSRIEAYNRTQAAAAPRQGCIGRACERVKQCTGRACERARQWWSGEKAEYLYEQGDF